MDAWARRAGNLSEHRTSRDIRTGAIVAGISLVIVVAVIRSGLGLPYRLLLFVPFLAATGALFRGLYGSCLHRAMRGQRETEEGLERIADPAERRRACAVGWRVVAHAVLLAAALTFAVVVLV